MLLWSVLLATTALALSYSKQGLSRSAAVLGLFAAAAWLFGAATGIVLIAAILAILLAVLTHQPLRAHWLSRPLLSLYKRLLPDISDTEETALKAGTVWWEGEIFSGKPDWNRLRAHPDQRLTPREQSFLDNQCDTLCSMINEWEITREGDMPAEVWDYIKQERFLGLIIPKEYGGLDFSAQAQSAILQKLSGLSVTAFCTVGVPNSLGPGELLVKYGTEEQKEYYLPRLADGRDIPCFALTGPRAGSDATSLPDTGIVCRGEYEGEQVIGIRLNFSKRYITLAPIATVVGLAFRLFDPEGLIGEEPDIGISLALLPRDLEGMEIGTRHKPLGSPFLNGPIKGKDVFIPLDFLIGGAPGRGQGWRMLVECLSVGRCITLPSIGVGSGKFGVAASGAYARLRRQFNIPICQLEGVQEALARVAGNTYIATAAARITAIAVDQGEKPSVAAAILKYNLTDIARHIAMDTMDIHGGKGVMTGPDNYLSSGYASVPVGITVEGANILTRTMITFGQGAIRCHPHVLSEMRAAHADDLAAFDQALFAHVGFAMTNATRSLVLGLTHGRLARVPVDTPVRHYYQQIERYAASFALMVDVCMLSLGGKLRFREMISGRLADMLSALYMASCVLKHWEDQEQASSDLPLVEYACKTLFYNFEAALSAVLDNLPNRLLAWVVRGLAFPRGRRARQPEDALINKISALITAHTDTRERMIQGAYRAATGPAFLHKYDALLTDVERAEPLYRKIHKAVKAGQYKNTELSIEGRIREGVALGVLSEEEASFMLDFEKEVLAIIEVNDFPLEHFGPVAQNRSPGAQPHTADSTPTAA